jgi:hypothetical protein
VPAQDNGPKKRSAWIEGGWLLVLSAVLIAVTVWLVRRRAT